MGAFSAAGAIEGAYFATSGKLVPLSEEQLVECARRNSGCDGGWMDDAFNWVKKNKGLCSEASYPYTSGRGQRGTCKTECRAVVTVAGFVHVPSRDENAMKIAVSTTPVSVAVAVNSKFSYYSRGIFDNSECRDEVNHGVLLVGYGAERGIDYWTVKNSWGDWGEHGNIRIARNNNQCCILDYASYPSGVEAVGHSLGSAATVAGSWPLTNNHNLFDNDERWLSRTTTGWPAWEESLMV